MSSTATARRVPTAADPVELFFDLAFVFSLAQLVAFLHHELTVTTVAQALVLLSLLWWAWSQFTWAVNAVGNDTRGVRALLVGATVAAIPLGASVGQAYAAAGDVFAAGWSALMVAGSPCTSRCCPTTRCSVVPCSASRSAPCRASPWSASARCSPTRRSASRPGPWRSWRWSARLR